MHLLPFRIVHLGLYEPVLVPMLPMLIICQRLLVLQSPITILDLFVSVCAGGMQCVRSL